jgi:FKBP-type peptidyl-prolyl cis-trans isomerase FkpA
MIFPLKLQKESAMMHRISSLFLSLALLAGLPQLARAADPAPAASPVTITDVKVGTGKEAQPGLTVSVHYTGWLFKPLARAQHGVQFDSSAGQSPFEFRLGAGQVIKGWDMGVAGMKVGGKRTLVIPSYLGYGGRGSGALIPPGADLIFDVELLDVK